MCKMRELFMRELYGFHESSFESDLWNIDTDSKIK